MGAITIVLALVIGILPLFTDCLSQGKVMTLANGMTVPMKCHWTAIAEIGVAIPLLLVGIFEITSKRKESLTILSVLGVVLGILAILFPTVLIGVCANPMMNCHMVMMPALILSGALVIIASIIVFVTSRKIEEPNA